MNVVKTAIPEVLIIEPQSFGDSRGFLMELYQADRYAASGVGGRFVQDNLSRSGKGTLRGLHFQNPKPQGKLVMVLRGAVLDVAVDLRRGSPTFGRHVAVELNDENRRQCWIPRGFAHGFLVRSDTADFFYKCDEFYSPADRDRAALGRSGPGHRLAVRSADAVGARPRRLEPRRARRRAAALPRSLTRIPVTGATGRLDS